jgi:hypothetical protein
MNCTRFWTTSKGIIALLAFGMMAVSCRKEPTLENTLPVYIPADCADHYFFGVGSYWIYQDSATGAMDSICVTDASMSMDTLYDTDGSLVGLYEYFAFQAEDTTGRMWIHRLPPSTENFFGLFRISRRAYQGSTYLGQDVYSFYPHSDTLIAGASGTLSVEGTLDTLYVGSVAYPNITIIGNTADNLEGGNASRRYFCPNYGMVREEVPATGKVRVLIRSGQ